jgi:hypothetical protein
VIPHIKIGIDWILGSLNQAYADRGWCSQQIFISPVFWGGEDRVFYRNVPHLSLFMRRGGAETRRNQQDW